MTLKSTRGNSLSWGKQLGCLANYKGIRISTKGQFARFEVIQPMFYLVKRQAKVGILPLPASEQVGVSYSYSPLGAGLLKGKHGVDKRT